MSGAVRQLAIVAFAGLSLVARAAPAQDAATATAPWEGEVSGSNVYVRSGAGANWYPTTKLGAGERVLVLGEKFGWYQITPPAGSFSYVDMAMVDRKGGAKTGIINQDKVYVRAGSTLEKRKNATQLVLNKGDVVEIIGEAEGFFKITPPPAATLYISKQYVKPVDPNKATGLAQRYTTAAQTPSRDSSAMTKIEAPVSTPSDSVSPTARDAVPVPASESASSGGSSPAGESGASKEAPSSGASAADGFPGDSAILTDEAAMAEPIDSIDTASGISKPVTEPATGATSAQKSAGAAGSDAQLSPRDSSKLVPVEPAGKVEASQGRYQAMLLTCESELVSLVSRPLEQQDVAGLIARYEEIAKQTDEHVPAEVAKIRIRQLNDRARLRTEHLASHQDEKDLAEYRATMEAERMRIMRRRVEAALQTYDLEGELRRSMAFAPESRRFRLVDPATGSTIAYVDVPRSVDENPEHLVGRRVGIVVAGKTFSPSARVPIAVARKVVDLSPREAAMPAPTATTEPAVDSTVQEE